MKEAGSQFRGLGVEALCHQWFPSAIQQASPRPLPSCSQYCSLSLKVP